jgi:hypothetical protein
MRSGRCRGKHRTDLSRLQGVRKGLFGPGARGAIMLGFNHIKQVRRKETKKNPTKKYH